MQSIYAPGASLLHRLHPLTKLVAAGLILAATYTLPWLLAPLGLLVLVLLLAASAGTAGWLARTVALLLAPVVLSLLLIQGILIPPPGATPLEIGPLTLTREGPLFAFVLSTRLLVLSSTVLLVLRTTHPADLIFALTERGLPQSVGYILLVSLQLVPDMSARATAILESQRSRGLETSGVLRRARALVPLIGPLVVGALVDVEARAMALESRAFLVKTPKTALRDLRDRPGERVARWMMGLALLALVVSRLVVFLT